MSLLDKARESSKWNEVVLGAMDEKDCLEVCITYILELRDDIEEIKNEIQQIKKYVNV